MTRKQHPSTSISLYRGALNFAKGAEVLTTNTTQLPIDAFGLLVSHSLEIALKSFLLSVGLDEKSLRKDIGHNLTKAWKTAVTNGLVLDSTPPAWCETLTSAHDNPYLFRYARTNTGLVVPAPHTLIANLRNVLSTIGEALCLDEDGNAV